MKFKKRMLDRNRTAENGIGWRCSNNESVGDFGPDNSSSRSHLDYRYCMQSDQSEFNATGAEEESIRGNNLLASEVNPTATLAGPSIRRNNRGICARIIGPLLPCFRPIETGSESEDDNMTLPSSERSGISSAQMAALNVELIGQINLMSPGSVRAGASSSTVKNTAPPYPVHSQADFVHYLVPNLTAIMNASYYWGDIDRFEAETMLDKKPEGTFLLRDSSQSDYIFSVSFRRYNRTLHARIEQLNHRFTFDAYDPNIFSSNSVSGVIEHYKDPKVCMFFEPLLTKPLPRKFPFSLQQLSRSIITDSVKSYEYIAKLNVAKSMREYLEEYHYKHLIYTRKLDV